MSQKSARRLRREEALAPRDGADPWLTLFDEFVDSAVQAYAGPAIPGAPTQADLDAMDPIVAVKYGFSVPR